MTTTHNIGAVWTQVGTCPLFVQCEGEALLHIGDGEPGANDSYLRRTSNELVTLKGDGQLWAKAPLGNAQLIVSRLPGGVETVP